MARRIVIVLLSALIVSLGFLACSKPGNVFCAGQGMHVIGEALEKYKSDHNASYPGTLAQLLPAYLPTIPHCSWTKSEPVYAVSASRSLYGLVCWGHHRKWGGIPEQAALVAVTTDHPYPEFDGNVPVEFCSKRLEKLATKVERYRRKTAKIPTDLAIFGDEVDQYDDASYALQVTNAGSYEIVCTRPEHVAYGLAPLEPRYDSRLHAVTAKRWGPSNHPYRWQFGKLLVVLVVLILLLIKLRIGRRANPLGAEF